MQEGMNRDEEHIRILSIFHYALSPVIALFACIPIVHLIIGMLFIIAPAKMADGAGRLPPPFFGWMFVVIGGALILSGWAYALSLILAGRFLARRKHYLFCLVIAGISCLFFPLGTILGVFTIIVLLRPSVKEQFKP